MVRRVPAFCSTSSGYARVKIHGKWVHLGKADDPQAEAKYRQLIAQWMLAPQTPLPDPEKDPDLTVAQLLLAYLEHVAAYYRHSPNRIGYVKRLVRTVRELYADLPARQFGPRRLKLVREAFVRKGYVRPQVNEATRGVVAMFSWAVEQELIPGSVVHALREVKGLRKGHSDAPEGRQVRPVPQATIDATRDHLCDVLADMVTVQVLTGMRSGELVTMTPGQLDRSGDVWTYRPEHHKTEHHGHARVIAIGPKAQSILTRYLLRPANACCFSPKEAVAQSLDTRHEQRQTPLSSGNRPDGRKRKRAIERVGDRYDVASYRRAIHRACRRAKVEPWSPHQLRHSAGTNVREQFGLDASQAVLGHRHARVTEVYAEVNVAKAAEVARVMG